MRRSGSVLGLPRRPRPWSAGTGAAVRIRVRVHRSGRVAGATADRRAQQWKQYEPSGRGALIGWLSRLGGAPGGQNRPTACGTCVLVGEERTSRVGAAAAALVSLRDRQRSGYSVTSRDLGTERHPYRSDITLRSHDALRLSPGPSTQVGHFGPFSKDPLPSGSAASYVRWIGNRPCDPFSGCARSTRTAQGGADGRTGVQGAGWDRRDGRTDPRDTTIGRPHGTRYGRSIPRTGWSWGERVARPAVAPPHDGTQTRTTRSRHGRLHRWGRPTS